VPSAQRCTLLSAVGSYVEVIKPRLTSLLVFSALAMMLIAFHEAGVGFQLDLLILGLVAISAASAGCNAVTSYTDRGIDGLMPRTSKRPVPSGRIHPPEKALFLGVALAGFALILAGMVGFLSFLFLAAGVFNNTVIYSLLFKRRTKFNILLGSPSGALAALFGWTVVAGNVTLLPVLASILVMLWIPTHIWSFAYYSREDYRRAGVPMLTAYTSEKTAARVLLLSVTLVFAYTIALIFLLGFGLIYVAFSLSSGLAVLAGGLRLFFKPGPRNARLLFKLSSPYLLLLFLGMVLDVFL